MKRLGPGQLQANNKTQFPRTVNLHRDEHGTIWSQSLQKPKSPPGEPSSVPRNGSIAPRTASELNWTTSPAPVTACERCFIVLR